MGIRKLFQPSHDRFYAVVVEVFCDHDGLPRPRPDDTFVPGPGRAAAGAARST